MTETTGSHRTWQGAMQRVYQHFDRPVVEDVEEVVRARIADPSVAATLDGLSTVALAVGSRGISGIDRITSTVVGCLRERGIDVFIVPSMGSHGGATAAGQEEVLAHLGITEASVGAPIRATMDVDEIGSVVSPYGREVPVYMDRYAHRDADAVVPINRVKPHTGFRGPVESGICKMLAIGLGKQAGAERLHSEGYGVFDRLILEAGRAVLATGHVAFGVGIIENAYDETAEIAVPPGNRVVELEPALLESARALMPGLLMPRVDVLVVEQFGKDISGVGMDANITGRGEEGVSLPGFGGPSIKRIVVLSLTEATGGNAHGIGLADVITQRVFDQIDTGVTWTNSVTSGSLACGRIPPALPTDDDAVMAAVRAVSGVDAADARVVRIKHTLALTEIAVSGPVLDDLSPIEECELDGPWDGTWSTV